MVKLIQNGRLFLPYQTAFFLELVELPPAKALLALERRRQPKECRDLRDATGDEQTV